MEEVEEEEEEEEKPILLGIIIKTDDGNRKKEEERRRRRTYVGFERKEPLILNRGDMLKYAHSWKGILKRKWGP